MYWSCRSLSRNLTRYAEGEGTAFERGVFRIHVATCTGCGRLWRQYQLTREAVRALVSLEPAPPHSLAAAQALLRGPRGDGG
jgi:anti-sigma factor RsiW